MQAFIDILLTIMGVSIILLIGWAVRENKNCNNYSDKVRKELEKNDCPLFSFNIMIDAYRRGDTPKDAAEEMMELWTGDTSIK